MWGNQGRVEDIVAEVHVRMMKTHEGNEHDELFDDNSFLGLGQQSPFDCILHRLVSVHGSLVKHHF